MQQQFFGDSGDLVITPSETSSEKDFDFLIGNWRVRNRKLKTRLKNCNEWLEFDATQELQTILGGIGNIDFFHASPGGTAFEGMTLRLFNPITRLWSIYWADGNTGTLDTPVIGSYYGNTGWFYCRDVFDGKPIIMAFKWDAADKDNPVWSQAFSPDNGKTWEWNWYMYFSRR